MSTPTFRPISSERAEEIRKAVAQSRANGEGLAVDRETGNLLGAAALKSAPQDKVNMIGKFDTHYSE